MKKGAAISACLLITLATVFLLRSRSIADELNRRAAGMLQRLTGVKSQIASTQIHWLDHSIDLQDVTLRQTESPGAQPLFRADHIHVKLPFSALFGRSSHLTSLEIDRPRIAISSPGFSLVTTNGRVGRLRIDHLRVHNGTFAVLDASVIVAAHLAPLNVEAFGVQLTSARKTKSGQYEIQCAAAQLRVMLFGAANPNATYLEGAFAAEAKIASHRLKISRLTWQTGSSVLNGNGEVNIANEWHGVLNFTAHLEATALPNELQTGTIDATGALLATEGEWQVSGSASARNISFRAPLPYRPPLDVQASYLATPQGLHLDALQVTGGLGSFDGSATLSNWIHLAATGVVNNLSVPAVVKHWAPAARWSGAAAGNVHLAAEVSISQKRVLVSDSKLDVDLNIVPGKSGLPLQGNIAGSYFGRSNTVRIGRLALQSQDLQVSCSGASNGLLNLHLRAASALDLDPLLRAIAGPALSPFARNLFATDIQFDGSFGRGALDGVVVLHQLTIGQIKWEMVRASASASSSSLRILSANLRTAGIQAILSGQTDLHDWTFDPSAATVEVTGKVTAARPERLLPAILNSRFISSASGHADFSLFGPIKRLSGQMQIVLEHPEMVGQLFTQATGTIAISPSQVTLSSARVTSGKATLSITASYSHSADIFSSGILSVRADTVNFPLAVSGSWPLLGSVSARSAATFLVTDHAVQFRSVSGELTSPELTISGTRYTDIGLSASTEDAHISAQAFAKYEGEPLQLAVQLYPQHDYSMHASISANKLDLVALAHAIHFPVAGLSGALKGNAIVDGPLAQPSAWRAHANVTELSLRKSVQDENVEMHNTHPALLDIAGGTAHLSDLTLANRDGQVALGGDVGLASPHALKLALNGSLGLQAFELLDANVVSSGTALLDAKVSGSLADPVINGTMRIQDGALSVKNLQTSITGVQAQVQFNRNRAFIDSLNGESGGGLLHIEGFVNYGEGAPPTYNLKAFVKGVRYRYANAIGITGDSALMLSGSTTSGLVSGDVQLSRVVVAPEVDLGSVLASRAAARQSAVSPGGLMPDLQLDVHVESQPNLQVSTAIARDVAAAIDVRIRGTASHPLVFGNISATQGDIRIFGAKYSINRCEITFVNTTRVEPVVDLDVETQSRGVAVDITISGRLDKLSMNYRSDPPLQPRDIIALLTVGEAPSFDPTATIQRGAPDVTALQAGANTVLGQAITPGSNRLSKLFGITNIKIDPLVQGLTNTPQSRLTIEQQISKNVTVTYITNLAETSEQIFRFEWALNPQYSVVAIRDDNGEFGIDVQYKRRFH